MAASIPFTFGIALIARAQARDWEVIEALLELTLASVRAQTDQDFAVLILGHDRPAAMPSDRRFRFVEADWPADRPDEHNSDAGLKKYRRGEEVLARGGGLLMLLDAEDWVDRRLVAFARERIGSEHVGGVIEDGYAADLRAMARLRLPHRRAFGIGFHRVCGSSVIGRLDPNAPDDIRREPCRMLGSHPRWLEAAQAQGVALARLPAVGGYLINTFENHSEHHGPHAAWRRELAQRVASLGLPLGGRLLRRFGLRPVQIEPVSRLLRMRSCEPEPMLTQPTLSPPP